jgi:thiamine transport system substrate-binding protein
MKQTISRSIFILLLAAMLVSCTGPASSPAAPAGAATLETNEGAGTSPTVAGSDAQVTLTIMTHDSFTVTESIIRQFEEENKVKLNFLQSGDAGSALNRAILSKGAPLADVFYGVDNTFLSRAVEADIFETYASPLLAEIPAEFKLDAQNRALPVDYGDVCINYDKAYFAEKNLPVPQTLQELTQPEYKNLLVVENPATSSPGMAFLLATIAEYKEDGYLNYWRQLRENGVVVANDWETAYYTNFSGSSGRGPQPMVVSYGSSPAAEVLFAETPPAEAPTASIIGKNTCFRQVEYVGILQGTKQRALAEKFVDLMLSKTFQEDMPLQMFVFPVNQQAQLPEAFQKHIQIPDQPAAVDSQLIAKSRDAWIQAWDETVLR